MDKVNGSNSQATPRRGHYSSVDAALKAHRQRNMERENRVTDRLNLVRNMQNQFFSSSGAVNHTNLIIDESIQTSGFQNQARVENQVQTPNQNFQINIPEAKLFNPIEMDDLYAEASMGSVADNALGIVQSEIANPEEAPIEDMPKGSYVDYTV